MLANTSRFVSLRAVRAQRVAVAPATRAMHASAPWLRGPPKPTASEEAVKHDDHDLSPEELRKKTAEEAKTEFESQKPTASEDAVKGDTYAEDPLPEHKKKRSPHPEH